MVVAAADVLLPGSHGRPCPACLQSAAVIQLSDWPWHARAHGSWGGGGGGSSVLRQGFCEVLPPGPAISQPAWGSGRASQCGRSKTLKSKLRSVKKKEEGATARNCSFRIVQSAPGPPAVLVCQQRTVRPMVCASEILFTTRPQGLGSDSRLTTQTGSFISRRHRR